MAGICISAVAKTAIMKDLKARSRSVWKMINKLLCFIFGHKYEIDTRMTTLRNLLELNIFDKDQVKVEVCIHCGKIK